MKKRNLILVLFLATVLSIGTVVLLFQLSEQKLAYQNNFTRRFPAYTQASKVLDLTYDSYYFAGMGNDSIYLGNITSGLTLTAVDSGLIYKREHKISIDNLDFPWHSPRMAVWGSYFFFFDGTVPVIFKGNIIAGKGVRQMSNMPMFFRGLVIDSSAIAYVFVDTSTKQSTIGKSNMGSLPSSFKNAGLLQKQVDGLFDSEGHLTYDHTTGQIVFVYRYRNQFFVMDKKLALMHRGNTIDTVSRARVKPVRFEKENMIKLSERPISVNKSCAADNGYLFVHSAIPGQFEPLELWDKASIIDIYDLKDRSYRGSFYVYHRKGKKLRSFLVKGNSFYGIIGNELVMYRMSSQLIK